MPCFSSDNAVLALSKDSVIRTIHLGILAYNGFMDPKSFKCPECEYFDELDGIRRHCVRSHGITAEQLYRMLFMAGREPTCECGCGQVITKFWGIEKGFSKYIRGHSSRVNNNWGHNAKALNKSHASRRESFSQGEWSAWNKGETKESDKRIAAYGRTQSQNFTPERRQVRSERMTENRLNKTIPDLNGKNHGMWKGGSSSLQQLTRSYLFRAWSRPIMERQRFTCQHCGVQGNLCVHHDKERFAEIPQKAMQHFQVADATQLTFDQKQELSLWVVDYHLDNRVSGLVLCEACHERAHVA